MNRTPRGGRAVRRLASLLVAALTLPTLLPALARAATAPPQLAELMSDAGWSHEATRDGVALFKKRLAGEKLLAWKGVKVVDAPPDVVLEVLLDVPGHLALDPRRVPLLASEVLARGGDRLDYLQVLDVPGLLGSDRYWFNRSTVERDVGGRDGHHLQKWWRLDGRTAYPDRWERVQGEHPGAIETVENIGAWEVLPTSDGRSQVIYRVFSDPGGNVPDWGQNLASGKTLPDNVDAFGREAEKRAGRR